MTLRGLLKSGSALDTSAFNTQLLAALTNSDPEQGKVIAAILGRDPANDNQTLSFEELSYVLRELHIRSLAVDATQLNRTPFGNPAFLENVANDMAGIQEQLQQLREQCKKERGFLSTVFNIFSREKPLDEVMKSAASFAEYCEENKISFDDIAQKFVTPSKTPSAFWESVKKNRFLIAATGGILLGLAGVNLAALPVLSMLPGLFFGGLPWLAAPFIGLNVFKSFTNYSVIKEAPTLARFAVITAAGFALSIGTNALIASTFGVINPANLPPAGEQSSSHGFNPMAYMPYIIGVCCAAALAYKRAKSVINPVPDAELSSAGDADIAETEDSWLKTKLPFLKDPWVEEKATYLKGNLSYVYNRAVGLAMNRHTAPAVAALGRLAEKATEGVNKLFPAYVDYIGIPAITTSISATMAVGGLSTLGLYAAYYLTMFAGMTVGAAALLLVYYKRCHCRGKDFKEIGLAALEGFLKSSSTATMPKERECLAALGVSQKTIDSVVPLGGVFNMYGTALYMGQTTFYAMQMFGQDPTLTTYLSTASTILGIALGAPGVPASNITLLSPVLVQTGMSPTEIQQVYTVIIPGDRPLDMAQTSLNVMGDMLAAADTDRHLIKKRHEKNSLSAA